MNHYTIYYDHKNGYYSNAVTVPEEHLVSTVNFIMKNLDGIIQRIEKVVIDT